MARRRLTNLCCVALATVVSAASEASGCPVCDSENGRQVRAGIAGGDVALGLLAAALPFAVVLAVAAVIHLGGPARKTLDGDDNN